MQTALKKRKRRPFFSRLFWLGLLGATGFTFFPHTKTLLGFRDPQQHSPVLQLAALPAAERDDKLADIIIQGGNAIEISQAKYLLASDLIQQEQGSKALKYLNNLEKDYPLLAPHILYKRALAHELVGEKKAVEKNLTQLAASYSNSPVAVEAWERLGKQDEKFWDQALSKFPHYPRSINIIQNMMERNPSNMDLMFTYLRSGGTRTAKGLEIADRLSSEYINRLQPTDWRLIAETYIQNGLPERAIVPLNRSPQTSENLLLIGQTARSIQKIPAAKTAYQELVTKHQNAPETEKALLELAELSANNREAISYLDKLAQQNDSPLAPAALVRKVMLLEKNQPAAQQVRTEIIQRFPKSEAAAGIRWEQALTAAAQKDQAKAWGIAKSIVSDSPDTRYSARASFWIGKWAQQLGRPADAKKAFTYTLVKYTQSYYSWRAAKYLGWDVGDFATLRSITPAIQKNQTNGSLPIGSDALKELYQIGAYKDAWALWQQEFPDRNHYSVTEQFVEGLLIKGLDRYQLALAKVSQLEKRETVIDKEQYRIVRQHPNYWSALYPLAYMDHIQAAARQRAINPLLVISIARQESKFDPETKSGMGALGLMQVMPSTAQFISAKVELPEYSLTVPADNIKLGTWYLAHVHDQVKDDSLLAIAGYNAGPGNVSKWVKEIGATDPDEFVEKIPFEETQGYVRNVLGNYWNYLRTYNPDISKQMSKFLVDYKT
jgi:soluble lytic murein transglycosylase